ncbi:NmrA family NAD(P)-binding protein [Paraburkholderia bannensis]|uniref:NmrA family NAD(P)-binding protein n=1 Tax=Paraburkholderia bannensis TaxID=765414 RepID=UPI002ABD295A|nr:NAD(P)H-binding protein [Paraburkholderia bannensis]
MFAITGMTGQVGGALAQALIEQQQAVRAVVRNAQKASAWAARGCEIAVAEMSDSAALHRAFEGTQGVFVLLPPVFDPSPDFAESTRNIAALRDALAQAQPQRVVVLSTIGAQASQPNLLNQLGLMEQALGTLPMPVAFLRAAWFFENAAWDVASARDQGTIESYLQPLDKPVPMVSTVDIGQLAARLLQETWSGVRVVELEGPRRVTPHDIAAAFALALHKPVQARAVPREQWEALFRAQGMNHPAPRMQMLDGFNEGWIEFESPADTLKGRVTLEQAIASLVERSA